MWVSWAAVFILCFALGSVPLVFQRQGYGLTASVLAVCLARLAVRPGANYVGCVHTSSSGCSSWIDLNSLNRSLPTCIWLHLWVLLNRMEGAMNSGRGEWWSRWWVVGTGVSPSRALQWGIRYVFTAYISHWCKSPTWKLGQERFLVSSMRMKHSGLWKVQAALHNF